MKKIIKPFLFTLIIILLLGLALSTSASMSVRIHLVLAGHPKLAINSNPKYDSGFSKMANQTVYSVAPKYAYVPIGAGGNTKNSFVVHKFWVFKVAMPIADSMY